MKSIEELRKNEFNKREKRLQNAIPQQLVQTNKEKNKLHITYVMTWTGICGGSKIILEHCNRLIRLGHEVSIISHDNKPTWFAIEEKIQVIQVPWEEVLCQKIPKCDVVVATYWREIYECIEQKIAPVVYFEQGDYHLFDMKALDDRTKKYIQSQLDTVKFVYTVSSFAKEKIMQIYNKESNVISNAVDNTIFYYTKHRTNEEIEITIIGSEDAEFKRINNILKSLNEIKNRGYKFKLNWITPTKPKAHTEIKSIVNPQQVIIGDILRKTDIYICASIYESFCLPVLEAMTCGAAIITTNNGGNMDFVKDGKNALLIKQDDTDDMQNKIITLMENKELRKKLVLNGLKTAEKYSWDKTMNQVVDYYKEIAKYEVK